MEVNPCLKSGASLSTSSTSLHTPINFRLHGKGIIFLKKQQPLYIFSVVASRKGENIPEVVLEEKEEPTVVHEGKGESSAVLEDDKQQEGNELQGNLNGVAPENGNVYVKPPEGAKVYVGNLPYEVDSKNLGRIFDRAGTVRFSEVKYSWETDESRGFGFVTMSTEAEAERAVEMLHGYDVHGRLLTVRKASPRRPPTECAPPPQIPQTPYRLYAGNLPWSVDSSYLERIFSKHGKVLSARVVCDPETGDSRGFGFVVMSSESEMNRAIKEANGRSLSGREMRVNKCSSKTDRSRHGES